MLFQETTPYLNFNSTTFSKMLFVFLITSGENTSNLFISSYIREEIKRKLNSHYISEVFEIIS